MGKNYLAPREGVARTPPPQDPSGQGERFPSPFPAWLEARGEAGEWSAEPGGFWGRRLAGERGAPRPVFFFFSGGCYGQGWRRNAPPSGEGPAGGEGLVEAAGIGAVSGRFWPTHGREEGRHGRWHPARRASPRCPRAQGAVSGAFQLADNAVCKFSAPNPETRFSSFFLREKTK